MEFTKTQTQPLTCSLAVGSLRLWAVPEAEMRKASLSGLDLREGPPRSCDVDEDYVWVSGPDGARDQGPGARWWPVSHLMLCGYLVCAMAWGRADFRGPVFLLEPCGHGWCVLPT